MIAGSQFVCRRVLDSEVQGCGYFLEAALTSADTTHTKNPRSLTRKKNVFVYFFCQHWYELNRSGPRTDPFGTLHIVTSHIYQSESQVRVR